MDNMERIEKIVAQLVGPRAGAARWREIEEWIRTSYTLVAPRRLARLVEATETNSR